VSFLQQVALFLPQPKKRTDLCLMSRNDNRGVERFMSLSTFVVLLALTFGQTLLLTCGLLVLWLAGEIGGGAHE
jgi:hypothetical protein